MEKKFEFRKNFIAKRKIENVGKIHTKTKRTQKILTCLNDYPKKAQDVGKSIMSGK